MKAPSLNSSFIHHPPLLIDHTLTVPYFTSTGVVTNSVTGNGTTSPVTLPDPSSYSEVMIRDRETMQVIAQEGTPVRTT